MITGNPPNMPRDHFGQKHFPPEFGTGKELSIKGPLHNSKNKKKFHTSFAASSRDQILRKKVFDQDGAGAYLRGFSIISK